LREWQKPNPAVQIVRKHFYAGTPFGGFKVFP